MTTPALLGLDAQLDAEDPDAVLAAAWDILSTSTALCDGITDEDSDELQAMIAAQKCSEGRDRLPLPETGRTVQAPPLAPGAAALVPYVRLLEHVGAALTRLSSTAAADEDSARRLLQVADLAVGAAAALTAVRERS
ncbi:hypothetical protein [Streptomyces sp. NPDC089799]|uniref:hypothetical protein n=1 Tax=Streptomyces sp. NPDC089799 TaxID=3155066 RepID=UPI00341B0A32